MEGPGTTVSVVVPTRDRPASLRRLLTSLGAQTLSPGAYEVLVVDDGSVSPVEVGPELLPPYALRVQRRPHEGPASARNAGAAAARGGLLVFLDDDVEAAPGLLEAHVRAHAAAARGLRDTVVIGYLPPVLVGQRGFFRIALRRWWEDRFAAMRQAGHRFHAFELLSGNFSLSADLFRRAGGFDPSFIVHEDFEFGVRLLAAGAQFLFAPDARGGHHESTDLPAALRRKFEEGRTDVALGRRHPHVRPALPLARPSPPWWRHRVFIRLALGRAALLPFVTALSVAALGGLERLRMRARWRRLLDDLLTYWYWRGVAAALGNAHAVRVFLTEPVSGPAEIEVDLSGGVAAAEHLLDTARPAGACLRYGARAVGRIRPHPGAEGLRGAHLRPLLATHLARPYLYALAEDGVIAPPLDVERLRSLCRRPLPYEVPGLDVPVPS